MYPWQTFILGLCEHLAWPVLVAVCIVYYREDLRRMLGRIKTLPGGTELSSETVEEQKDSKEMYEKILAENNRLKNEQADAEKALTEIIHGKGGKK